LCADTVNLGRLFAEVLRPYEADLVYWAHVTSPFVTPASIAKALDSVATTPGLCVVGAELLREFLWDEQGPRNYDPARQPNSQDLPPLWRVTGGIHAALGHRFIQMGSLVFAPHEFIEMTKIEGLDINTPDEWDLCERLAPSVLPGLLDGPRKFGRSSQ
jgi:CMP-N-acetylneuraminic acid synthetase